MKLNLINGLLSKRLNGIDAGVVCDLFDGNWNGFSTNIDEWVSLINGGGIGYDESVPSILQTLVGTKDVKDNFKFSKVGSYVRVCKGFIEGNGELNELSVKNISGIAIIFVNGELKIKTSNSQKTQVNLKNGSNRIEYWQICTYGSGNFGNITINQTDDYAVYLNSASINELKNNRLQAIAAENKRIADEKDEADRIAKEKKDEADRIAKEKKDEADRIFYASIGQRPPVINTDPPKKDNTLLFVGGGILVVGLLAFVLTRKKGK